MDRHGILTSEWMTISEKSRAGTQQDNRRSSRNAIALAGHDRLGAAVCDIFRRSDARYRRRGATGIRRALLAAQTRVAPRTR